jgi:hypothetical protein
MALKDELNKLALEQSNESFKKEYIASTDEDQLKEEGLGILISKWAEWDGSTIMRVFRSALEDSNFHDEAEQVDKMLLKYE